MNSPVQCSVYEGDKLLGSQRTKSGFLLFPKCIDGKWRWLKTAKWIEMYQIFSTIYLDGGICRRVEYRWEPIKWADI